MIEMKNVSKWYGTFSVLKECSTSVSKGEVVVICGPSGLSVWLTPVKNCEGIICGKQI
jgi:ABC-type polar amino acid transport system ATPase subunit